MQIYVIKYIQNKLIVIFFAKKRLFIIIINKKKADYLKPAFLKQSKKIIMKLLMASFDLHKECLKVQNN